MGVIRIAVDAMGGDFAPDEIVKGAIQGACEWGTELSLVGDAQAIEKALSTTEAHGVSYEIVPARDAIPFEVNPAWAVKNLPQASINVACQQVLEGKADGVLTMGHTGAAMIAAVFHFDRIPGISRPAFIVPFLGFQEHLFLIDVGGNTDVRPRHLVEFALMGSAYASRVADIPSPRVALLSNGEEPNKGNKIGKAAYPLLEGTPGLNFVGNVEGHTLLDGKADVVISDGFAGNILFKAAEGLVPAVLKQVAEILPRIPRHTAKFLREHLDAVRARNHYARYGASALLGVQHPIFTGHGRSKAEAVKNGVLTAKKMIAGNVVAKIREALAAL